MFARSVVNSSVTERSRFAHLSHRYDVPRPISRKGAAMPSLFSRPGFSGFGPNRLAPDELPAVTVVRGRAGRLRRRVREHCPRLPGVYGMLDAHGELIYVG